MEVAENFGFEGKFIDLDYWFKKDLTKKSLKKLTFVELLCKNQRIIKVGDADFYLSPKIMMFDIFLLNIKNKYKYDDASLYIYKIKEVIVRQ